MPKQLVSLIIDGQSVSVPAGTLIVDAAKQVGIDIPVFCYHPKMEPVGMCRMCLVEVGRPVIDRVSGQPVIEGGKPKIQFGAKLETACTTPVSEDMQVVGMSEKARTGRKEIVEFLLTSHPLDCPVCDKGGECPLQNLTMAHGSSESRFKFDDKQHQKKHVPLGDLIWLDRERCIQCARCIRFQGEIVGDAVLDFFRRGRATDIVTYSEPGFDSIFSSNTTDICPVGALTTADFRFGARPWEMNSAASICTHCPVGCNTTLNIRREARSDGNMVIKRIMPRQNEQVNEIWLCDKGRFAHHFSASPDRLAKPLVRTGELVTESSWEEALNLAARSLVEAKQDFIVLAGGRLANEDLFNLKALADGLGGKAALYTHMGGGYLTTLAGVSMDTNFGEMGAGTSILVAASDLYNEAPLWYLRIKQAAARGATLILAGARETKLEKYAAHVIRYAYGDEAQTIKSMQKSKAGQAAAEALASAQNLVVLYGSDGLGLEGSASLAEACAGLLDMTGHAGKPGSGLIGVWPHANDQGAWEMGFQPVADLAAEFKNKLVYIAACDPVGDDPALAEALKSARFVIVQELFQTETTRLANVVLPAQAFTEREGSFTSGERRVQRFYPALPAFGETRPDFSITASLAQKAGLELEGTSALLIMNKIASKYKSFEGLSYARLAEVREQWPLVGRGDIYYGGAIYANTQGLGTRLALLEAGSLPGTKPVESKRPSESELLAIPVCKIYDRGVTVLPSTLLHPHIGDASVSLHPDTAVRFKVQAGSTAQLTVNGTAYQVKVLVDEKVPASVALLPRSMGIPINTPATISLKAA
ncbi:MAG: NADH dehydrogenase (quinone) subunit G [Chloroflexi bacterium GWB2_49_20]|nr:MAG: NADH dehydrogenase (quinone) subunit G [Chloroflexi bacterium GWB2_49_20]OGN79230.1 MAG: NADH dehydrogenase (quinone) subunit G [Chloroflexi bacterium GWC2_49_37]OGN83000.1 MAG: NADH dehydrogenase (quinone) subunit G [Chloroflexi bacterium GWD2_49_16]